MQWWVETASSLHLAYFFTCFSRPSRLDGKFHSYRDARTTPLSPKSKSMVPKCVIISRRVRTEWRILIPKAPLLLEVDSSPLEFWIDRDVKFTCSKLAVQIRLPKISKIIYFLSSILRGVANAVKNHTSPGFGQNEMFINRDIHMG